MPTSFVISPPYPIPGMTARLTLSGADADANFWRASVTAAPVGSALRVRLDGSGKERVQVHESDLAVPYDLKLDKGGVYHFLIEEFTRGSSANGGGWEGSPAAAPSLDKLAESTQTLHVGERCDIKLGVAPDTATLSLFVFDETIRATSFAVHTIETPGIFSPSSQIATNAAADPLLEDALAALVDITAASAVGSIATLTDSLIESYNNHIAYLTSHNGADTYNDVDEGCVSASPEALPEVLNLFRRKLEAHMGDTDGSGTAAGYHDNHDNRNKFSRAGGAGDGLSSWNAYLDLRRVFEQHLSTASGVHNVIDVVNGPLTVIPPIPAVLNIFLSALLSATPSVPETVNTGAAYLRKRMSATSP
jgi:hypothetical protein